MMLIDTDTGIFYETDTVGFERGFFTATPPSKALLNLSNTPYTHSQKKMIKWRPSKPNN